MAEARIHPTAVVDSQAEIGPDTVVGPYCIIEGPVRIGADCQLQHHVTICGPTQIGDRNRFFAYGSIGQQTQDLKYQGEPTHLVIGDDNCFREFVTAHRATGRDDRTVIGNRNHFLAYAHIAHDCVIGNSVILSNNGTLAGHVHVDDFAVVGGLSAVHQFCRIGKHAITGGCSKIVHDVPPYMTVDGNPARVMAINKVGLERRGFPPETIRKLREAFRFLYRKGLNVGPALEAIRENLGVAPELEEIMRFVDSSQRGIGRAAAK